MLNIHSRQIKIKESKVTEQVILTEEKKDINKKQYKSTISYALEYSTMYYSYIHLYMLVIKSAYCPNLNLSSSLTPPSTYSTSYLHV